MKSIDEETVAILEVAQRTQVKEFPDARRFIAERDPGALPILDAISTGAATPDRGDIVMCQLHRRKKRFRDNVIGRCADCREAIEHRPDVPRRPAKVCAFCALRRLRGDA